MKIYPYTMSSVAAALLSNKLGVKRLREEGPPIVTDVVINWGASHIPRDIHFDIMLNLPGAIKLSLSQKYKVPKKMMNKREFRIHVFRDDAFLVQVRQGKVLIDEDGDVHWDAKKAAITTVSNLGLDFAAVDVVWDKDNDKYYISKVNTAPNLDELIGEKYCEQFRQFLN